MFEVAQAWMWNAAVSSVDFHKKTKTGEKKREKNAIDEKKTVKKVQYSDWKQGKN